MEKYIIPRAFALGVLRRKKVSISILLTLPETLFLFFMDFDGTPSNFLIKADAVDDCLNILHNHL